MIPAEDQLELWDKLEKILTHESGSNAVTTSQVFDSFLIPASASADFACQGKACSAKLRQFRGVPVVSSTSNLQECFRESPASVVPQDPKKNIQTKRYYRNGCPRRGFWKEKLNVPIAR